MTWTWNPDSRGEETFLLFFLSSRPPPKCSLAHMHMMRLPYYKDKRLFRGIPNSFDPGPRFFWANDNLYGIGVGYCLPMKQRGGGGGNTPHRRDFRVRLVPCRDPNKKRVTNRIPGTLYSPAFRGETAPVLSRAASNRCARFPWGNCRESRRDRCAPFA